MKTTPCSHGFKIYRPGQTDKLIELIYRISESKNHGFVFEKQIKIRELSVWVIRKYQRISSFHETTGKESKVSKGFFFKISKKIEDLGSTPKPSFMQNHGEAKKHVQEDKKNRRWIVLN